MDQGTEVGVKEAAVVFGDMNFLRLNFPFLETITSIGLYILHDGNDDDRKWIHL